MRSWIGFFILMNLARSLLRELCSSLSIMLAREALSISFLISRGVLFDDQRQDFRRQFDREVEIAQVVYDQV